MGGKRDKKRPAQEHFPKSAKVPRGGSIASGVPQMTFSWSVASADFDGPFGWHVTDTKLVFDDVIPKLKSFETMTWAQIDGPSGSHFISFDSLCKAAQDRLKHLQRQDIEQMFSLRLTGPKRIYGVREGATLEIIWWDPDHQICPSEKKGT